MTSRASRDRASWAPAVVGLAALPLLLLAPALLGDQAFVGLHTQDLGPWRGDGAADTRPLVADQPLAVRAVTLDKTLSCWPLLDLTLTRFLRGEAPLWNPDNLCGVPLLAQATHGTLHPPNWLAAVMPMGEAFGWTAWLQSALAGIFAFLLARELGAPRVAAFLGGLTFMLSGYMSARWHWYPITGSSMYLPLALLGIERMFRGARLGAVTYTALAVGGAFLSGFMQGAVHLCYACAIWGAARLLPALRGTVPERRAALGAAARAASALVLGLLLALPQLGPTVEYVATGESARDTVTPDDLRTLAMEPAALATVVLPNALGHPLDLADHPQPLLRSSGALRRVLDKPNSNAVETASHLGVASLVLVLLGVASGRRGRTLALALLGAGALLAVDTPLLYVVGRLPGLASGDPRRFVLLLSMGGALLAAMGLSELLQRGVPRWLLRTTVVLAALAGLAALALGTDALAADAWARGLAPPLARSLGVTEAEVLASADDLAYDRRLLADALTWLATTLALCAGALAVARSRRVAGAVALVAIAVVDLGWTAHRNVTTVTSRDLFGPPPDLAALADVGRLVRFHPGAPDDMTGIALPPNTALPFGVTDLAGYWALAPRRFVEVVDRIQPGISFDLGMTAVTRPDALDSPLLDALSATHVLSSVPLEREGLTARGMVGDGWLYERSRPMPRAYLSAVEPVSDASEALRRLAAADFDPRAGTIVEPTPSGEAPPDVPSVARASSGDGAAVRIAVDEPEEVRLEVDSPSPAVVVLTDAWLPGWSATVDGEPATIWPANHAVRAVAVESGTSEVVFRYDSPAWRWSIALAGLSLLALLGTGLLALRRLG